MRLENIIRTTLAELEPLCCTSNMQLHVLHPAMFLTYVEDMPEIENDAIVAHVRDALADVTVSMAEQDNPKKYDKEYYVERIAESFYADHFSSFHVKAVDGPDQTFVLLDARIPKQTLLRMLCDADPKDTLIEHAEAEAETEAQPQPDKIQNQDIKDISTYLTFSSTAYDVGDVYRYILLHEIGHGLLHTYPHQFPFPAESEHHYQIRHELTADVFAALMHLKMSGSPELLQDIARVRTIALAENGKPYTHFTTLALQNILEEMPPEDLPENPEIIFQMAMNLADRHASNFAPENWRAGFDEAGNLTHPEVLQFTRNALEKHMAGYETTTELGEILELLDMHPPIVQQDILLTEMTKISLEKGDGQPLAPGIDSLYDHLGDLLEATTPGTQKDQPQR